MGLGKKSISIIILIIFAFVSGCQSLNGVWSPAKNTGVESKIQDDYWPTDEWRASTPEEQGMDSGKLADMLENKRFGPIRSALVIRNGYLVLEAYRAPYDKETPCNTKSASKSIMSALTGIAIREKYIDSIDQKVAELLPRHFENADPKKKNITVKNLLTMTAGIKSSDPAGDPINWARSKDWVRYTINQPVIDAPGKHFNYDTGLTHLMSAVISETSGMATLEFARKYLFDPMGIKAGRWIRDPQGYNVGGSELELTPQDMAKFGYLYLQKGMWNGQQLVPREWVEGSLKNQVNGTSFNNPVNEYGYWWWLDKDYYFAWGWGGQYIIVNPKLDMVVVFTAINDAAPLEFYRSQILPAVMSDSSIAPNSSDADRLKKNIEGLARPKNDYAAPNPELIERISGKTFNCEENALGLDSFSISFDNSHCNIRYKQKAIDGKQYTSEFPVGLNGEYQISQTEYYETRLGSEMQFFPINIPGAGDKYPVAFEGHWTDKGKFLVSGMWPLGDPVSFTADFEFEGNNAKVRLTLIPTPYQFNVNGVMSLE